MAQTFIKKWHGKTLSDAGAYVSKDYRLFQNAFVKEISAIAESIGANVATSHKGHYDTSCFVERQGKFVYIHHDSTLERDMGCYVEIDLNGILIRIAESEKDYTGGANHHCDFQYLKENINRLLTH